MRTTVTIPDDLLEATMKLSGSKKLSEAVVISLKDYVSIKKRLALIDSLSNEKDNKKIANYSEVKKKRQARSWSK